ncbi:unnamed protein product [Tuber aestivum]|uniref:Guanine nucleotide-binding protein-like 3 N-terminal domain-containing protein n=1 Tax=Tuber aestivum TaxID=59557 RepID=A0A292PSK1_9PEZI|nr:unnamed protein product [Tuber aestivum]
MKDKLNIPGCFPNKIVYSKIEEGKLFKEQEQLRRELAKQRNEELVGRAEGREDARQDQGGGYESSSELYSDAMDKNDANSRIFKQVVDAAGITLYVLDARDPEGTRSRDVERQIMGADGSEKRLILILNKIYLVQGTPEWVVGLSPQRLPNAATKR